MSPVTNRRTQQGCDPAEVLMQKWIDEARRDREDVKREYGAFFDEVSALLLAHDPIGIDFGSNTDEYDPEAGTLLPRLSACRSPADVQRVVHEEFVHWFGADTAGAYQEYAAVSERIWSAWRAYRAAGSAVRRR